MEICLHPETQLLHEVLHRLKTVLPLINRPGRLIFDIEGGLYSENPVRQQLSLNVFEDIKGPSRGVEICTIRSFDGIFAGQLEIIHEDDQQEGEHVFPFQFMATDSEIIVGFAELLTKIIFEFFTTGNLPDKLNVNPQLNFPPQGT